jgi:hypothetical protein
MTKVADDSFKMDDSFLRKNSAEEQGENIHFDKADDRNFNNNKEKVTVKETCSMSHIQVLTLKEIKPVAFEVLLQYIYNVVLPNYLKFSAML